jgi:phosphatidylethanolamine-binding protein (PEBP) family uncharacterized protein
MTSDRLKTHSLWLVPEFTPSVDLEIKFEKATAKQGNVILPSLSSKAPKILFQHHSKQYTVIMIDPDVPSLFQPSALHWSMTNVVFDDEGNYKGETLNDYGGPGPPPFHGLHRYIFIVFAQSEKVDFEQFTKVCSQGALFGRAQWNNTQALMDKLKLTPVGIDWFEAEHESACNIQ